MNHDLIYCPDDFINNMEHIHFEKGDIIIRRNSCPDYVYVVISGIANTTYVSSRGKAVIVSHFLKGDYIGELSAICSQKFLFDVIAQSEMELVKIPSNMFIQRMQTDFRLVQSMVQSQNNRINYVENFVLVNSTLPIYEKVLLFLCCFLAREDYRKAFTKSFLVSFIGTDIRCINRVLHQMCEKGFIQTKKGQIIITDYPKLRKEAEDYDIDYQIDFFYNYILDGSDTVNLNYQDIWDEL